MIAKFLIEGIQILNKCQEVGIGTGIGAIVGITLTDRVLAARHKKEPEWKQLMKKCEANWQFREDSTDQQCRNLFLSDVWFLKE